MIRRVIRFSAENRFLVLGAVVVLMVLAAYAVREIPLDALPDLSDTQVIVASRWDRSPDILEDQVTYPIIATLLGAPKVKAIRGFSDFGFSYVYVIFEDGTDLYWARSRVLEYLSKIQSRLPEGVKTGSVPTPRAWGGSISTRWWIAKLDTPWTSCAPTRTGRCATRCSRSPASPRWRRSAVTSGSTRSPSIPIGCRPRDCRWAPSSTRSDAPTTRSVEG